MASTLIPTVPWSDLDGLRAIVANRPHRDPEDYLDELETQLAQVFDANEAAEMTAPIRQALADEDYRTLDRLLNEVEPWLSQAGSAMVGPCVALLNLFGTAEPAV